MTSPLARAEPLTFGSYELLDKVATGGMAEVYRARARRPGGVKKIVCLKRIHPNLCADPSFVDMFIEEARLGVTLSHGNIVPVFDFGCIDGYHYLVMDFVEGYDLAQVLARARIVEEPFSRELALYVALEVLEGLSYAHERLDEHGRSLELVHRDISPSNVMVSGAGEVKILDFGIARSALREFRTRTGVVKGKPGYMAPEQARGVEVDARVDVYACGVMLREMLTGRRPDADSDDEAEGDLDDEPIEAILARALAEDPNERFDDAGEMAGEISALLLDRGQRPRAVHLSQYVDGLFSARAATPDWSHGDDAVDRHLAALLPDVTTDEITVNAVPSPSPDESTESTESTEELPARSSTERLGPSERPRLSPDPGEPPSRRSWPVAVALVLLALAGAVLILAWPSESPTELAAPAAPSPPPSPQTTSAEARLEVRSSPPGASVSLDGEELEMVTPADLQLPPGEHRLRLLLDRHRPLERVVELRPAQQVLLDLTLSPWSGEVELTSDPAGAAVLVDGESVGETPWQGSGLDRSVAHRLELRLEGYQPWRREFSFDSRQRVALAADLVRRSAPRPPAAQGTGYLSVVALPWAEVLLDGRSLGETPILRHRVTSGRHVVVLRNTPRGSEVRRVVTITAGAEERISVDLTQDQS